MTSLDDVARAAGVSTATASRALSGRGRISDATRERVRGTADALGYVASATASSLASGRAENVGVVVPLMDRWFFATVLDGIAARLASRGYDLTLYNVTDDRAQRSRLFETSLRRGRVDGLIVLAIPLSDDEVTRLQALKIPVLGLGVPRREIATLRVDDIAVGRAATEHLIALGHRDIAHVGNTRPNADGADADLDIPTLRRLGFEQAMADAGIVNPQLGDADFTVEGARAVTHQLLGGPRPPTAIFAASDEMAYGVLAAARDRGLTVPRDLSVIGVDGHVLADLFRLTTINQFPHAQGERAGTAILSALDTPSTPSGSARAAAPARLEELASSEASLPFELVLRGTTAAPRSAPLASA